jgi:hypothetical protein
MAKTTTPEQEKSTDTVVDVQEAAQQTNPFDDNSWGDGKPQQAVPETKPKTTETEDELVEEDAFVKEHFGFDNLDAAKKELAELKELKEKGSSFKFANEQSENEKLMRSLQDGNYDEVLTYLQSKKQFEKIDKLEIANAKEAEDILKTLYRHKYKDLNDDEVRDQLNDEYPRPKKPEQGLDETDEEYEDTMKEWESKNKAIDKKIIRDAKLAKPEVLKFRDEIVFPEMSAKESGKPPTQEELDEAKKITESFMQSVESGIKGFNGFSVAVKDKDVDYTVSYGVSDEAKSAINEQLKQFAEEGFNANALLASRWVDDKGAIKTNQMIEDLSLIYEKDKVLQKVANDAANKRIEAYLKEKKQINVNQGNQQGTFSPQADDKSELQKMQDFFWSQS